MHCTNGIIIQLGSPNPNPTVSKRTGKVTRKRSFEALPSTIASYISKKRADPKHLKDVSFERINGSLEKSMFLDFIWTLCTDVNPCKTPNWSGFNYLLHDEGDNEETQFVTYLPAIDQSPTNMDTVLEMLLQSKAKAEHLGLSDTDVVVDQTIYAKAVEIIENPTYKDLKEFIVLRMGAFHTSCVFITVIGKRFGDAGLKDLLIESELFGEYYTIYK